MMMLWILLNVEDDDESDVVLEHKVRHQICKSYLSSDWDTCSIGSQQQNPRCGSAIQVFVTNTKNPLF